MIDELEGLLNECVSKINAKYPLVETERFSRGKWYRFRFFLERVECDEELGCMIIGSLSPPFDQSGVLCEGLAIGVQSKSCARWAALKRPSMLEIIAQLSDETPLPAINVYPFGENRKLITLILTNPRCELIETSDADREVDIRKKKQFDHASINPFHGGEQSCKKWISREMAEFTDWAYVANDPPNYNDLCEFWTKVASVIDDRIAEIANATLSFAFDTGEYTFLLEGDANLQFRLVGKDNWESLFLRSSSISDFEDSMLTGMISPLNSEFGARLLKQFSERGCTELQLELERSSLAEYVWTA